MSNCFWDGCIDVLWNVKKKLVVWCGVSQSASEQVVVLGHCIVFFLFHRRTPIIKSHALLLCCERARRSIFPFLYELSMQLLVVVPLHTITMKRIILSRRSSRLLLCVTQPNNTPTPIPTQHTHTLLSQQNTHPTFTSLAGVVVFRTEAEFVYFNLLYLYVYLYIF